MRILFSLDLLNYSDCDIPFVRPSARCIIIKNELIAVVYSQKYDYYKFPGGGIEKNETPIDACIRETKEETGIIIESKDLSFYGIVKRKEKINENTLFIQDNYYYLVNRFNLTNMQNLDKYEQEEGFTLKFVSPSEMIDVNLNHSHGNTNQTMLLRDAKICELLIKEGYIK